MKKTEIKKFEIVTNGIVNIFFFIAVIICCIVMIYSLYIFIKSCNDSKERINELANSYVEQQVVQTSAENITDAENITEDPTENITNYADVISNNNERFIEYTMKLQELEAKTSSTNILTFIYTFLSGVLIGVATYFTKKNSDSVHQIKENKNLIESLNNQFLYDRFCTRAQRLYSTMQIFSISLDKVVTDKNESTPKNGTTNKKGATTKNGTANKKGVTQKNEATDNNQNAFINKNLPRLNVLINEFKTFAEENKNSVSVFSDSDKNSIITDLNEIGDLIKTICVPDDNSLINDNTLAEWENQLDKIKKVLKNTNIQIL